MGIGASIFLIAVGAIIAFALDASVGWLDLDVVGWVLMLAGLFGLLLTFGVFSRRRRTVVEAAPRRTAVETPGQPVVGQPVVGQPAVVEPQRRVTEYEEIERPL